MKAYRPIFLFIRALAAVCVCCFILGLCSCVPKKKEPVADRAEDYTGKIFFENRRYTFEGNSDCISAEDDALIIKREGTYLLSGKLTEGRIIADAPSVRLVLSGVELCSSVSSAVESRRGALIIESAEGSQNILRSECAGDGEPRGAVHTLGDIFLVGTGKTVISAPRLPYAVVCHRFFSEGGSLSLTAEGGIFTSEARISGGKITVSGAKTGIYAHGGEGSSGLIEMTGGTLVAVCRETALLAAEELRLTGGERDISAPKPYVCVKEENSEKDESSDKNK